MALKDDFDASERERFIKQIVDKLFQGIRSAINNGEPRRWTWELVQNAKDILNSHGLVHIKVTLGEQDLK